MRSGQRAPTRAGSGGYNQWIDMDPELRRMARWVVTALVATVTFALIVVELTLRWFG